MAIHFAKSCQVNLRESNLNTGLELVKRKKFDTSSIDVDLCHRLETIAHEALPGTNIIASEELIKCLKDQPARCEFIGSYLFKGQPQTTGVYVIQSYLVKPEHILHFRSLMDKNYNALRLVS